MRLAVWVTEGTWPATIDAARDLIGDDQAEVMLIHVLEAGRPPREGFGSLMGSGRVRHSEHEMNQLSQDAAQQMLDQAAERLGRPATVRLETGFPERIVTAFADEVDYLVIGRDGDRSRLGPHSLGKHTRFVVDHAPCRVLLIWPGDVPSSGSIPPPPPDR